MIISKSSKNFCLTLCLCALFQSFFHSNAADPDPVGRGLPFPPVLPNGERVATATSERFLEPPESLQEGVAIAKTPPTVDFMYYPGQTYVGKPWSNWGEGMAVENTYYSAIGDHLGFGGKNTPKTGNLGNAFVYAYDAKKKELRMLTDIQQLLNMPEGHYTPGKVHGRVDLARDGWLYYSTHRGSIMATVPEFHYKGDWILRTHPETGESEIVAHGPIPEHSIPNSVVDPERMISYGGTRFGGLRRGVDKHPEHELFFAYDLVEKKVLYSASKASPFGLPFSRSTGRVYYTSGDAHDLKIMRYDPEENEATEIDGDSRFMGHAAPESKDGYIYTASFHRNNDQAGIYALHVPTEKIEFLGPFHVGEKIRQVASLAIDPNGRFLYYTPGSHGGSEFTGTPIVQFDVKTGQRKVIAFLHPFCQEEYGATLKGTYSVAIDPKGDKLYATWNVSRDSKVWDSCALTVIHIPESERVASPR